MRKSVLIGLALATFATANAVPAAAQNDTAVADPAATTYAAPAQDGDDDSGKWGLAGLLGLIGLMGLKRRDHDHNHVRHDAGTTTRR